MIWVSLVVVVVTVATPITTTAKGESPDRIRGWVTQLADSDPAVWREAQVRLAVSGREGLRQIEASRLPRNAALQSRVKPVLSLALLISITPEDLAQHRSASTLAAKDIARGFVIAETLAALPYYDTGDPGLTFWDMTQEPPPPTQVGRILSELFELGGFKVPALLALCRDPRPVARAYGASLLRDVGTVSGHLDSLRSDRTPITILGGCVIEDGTVADMARRPSTNAGQEPAGLAFERVLTQMDIVNHAYDGMFDLINAIRQTSNAMEATTWDEWWEEARPTWRDWWRLSGSGLRPPDREEWLNVQRAYEGFRLTRRPATEPRSLVNIVGPPGTFCRVETGGTTLAQGRLPLRVVREQDSLMVADGIRGDEANTFAVTASLPNGQTFIKNAFIWEDASIWTLEILLEPRPRKP